MLNHNLQTSTPPSLEGPRTWCHIMYALHAFSALSGVLSPAFVVTAFLFGWPSIIAVIINYSKQGDVRGTWLESHYRWQLRTFWYAALWVLIAGLLTITLIGIPAAWLIALVTGIWILYRVIRGWVALLEKRPMPVPSFPAP